MKKKAVKYNRTYQRQATKEYFELIGMCPSNNKLRMRKWPVFRYKQYNSALFLHSRMRNITSLERGK